MTNIIEKCIALTSFLLIMSFVFLWTLPAAKADEMIDEIRDLKKRIEQLEKQLAKQGSKIQEQESKISARDHESEEIKKIKNAIGNLEFSIGATSVVQGTINNDKNQRNALGMDNKGDDADAAYSVDIEITSKIGASGMALLYLEAGEGDGLNGEAGGFTGVNADATGDDADVQVSELWYEHNFYNGVLTATVGKMDVTRWFDANEAANDECAQFLSDQFVNNIAVDFPDYSYGARVSWYPNDFFEINAGYLEADGDFEDLFDDNFYITEAVLKPKLGSLRGNYRFYAWRNSGEHKKLRAPWRTDKTGEGVGASIDQQLSEHITVFCRFGQQSDDVYEIRRAWSFGLQIAGGLWDREDDMLGIAFGAAETSGAYREVIRDDGLGTTPAESRFEAYYRYRINEHLAISPDVQWVDGLSGASNADAMAVLGVRAQLDF